MNKKRLLALLLALLSILSALCLASCGEKTEQTEEVEETLPPEETSGETEPLYANIPEGFSYGDETITFLVAQDSDDDWVCRDIYEEIETEDPIVTAVFRRNATLAEKYDVNIAHAPMDSAGSVAQRSIKSGSTDYQVLMCRTGETISLVQNHLLMDLASLEGIDLSMPWWDQNLVNNCSLGGKNFFVTGDISIMDNDATWVMMFNKAMITQYDLESPYDLVARNEWTFDKMYEMMHIVAGDGRGDDGNGKVDYHLDKFGWVTHNSSRDGLYYAAGLQTVVKDESDMPYFTKADLERTVNVLTQCQKMWTDKTLTWSADRDGYSAVELQEIFESGRALFMGEVMQLVIRLREMEIDFGVIPFPKFNSEQENYGHFVHPTSVLLSMPYNLDEETATKVSYVLEAMACESMYTLTPAYYETALIGKFFRDPESSDMLDIILKSRTFDLGYMFSWGSGMVQIFTNQITSGGADYISSYNRSVEKYQKQMDKAVRKLLDD